MNLTQFEKAKSLFIQIQTIDAEIKNYDKMAKQLVNLKNNQNIEISITVNTPNKSRRDKSKEKKQNDSVSFGLRGMHFMGRGVSPFPMFLDDIDRPSKPAIKQDSLTEAIADTTALEILGLLIKEKLSLKQTLVQRLKRLGVTI